VREGHQIVKKLYPRKYSGEGNYEDGEEKKGFLKGDRGKPRNRTSRKPDEQMYIKKGSIRTVSRRH